MMKKKKKKKKVPFNVEEALADAEGASQEQPAEETPKTKEEKKEEKDLDGNTKIIYNIGQ